MMFLILIQFACDTEPTNKEVVNDGTVIQDLDGDGYVSEEDCNDLDGDIYPSAMELCDGIDQNCNGEVDEGVLQEFFADSDGDGFGNPLIVSLSCELPSGYVDNGSDCNDTNASAYPSAEEVCDEIDNDCDAEIDEDVKIDFYVDVDEDGVGGENVEAHCELQIGLSQLTGDCDDLNSQIHPLVPEICDDIDNNCDGQIDENLLTTYYLDVDEDNYGSDIDFVEACNQPEGYVPKSGDCNDIDSLIHPTNFEICDGVDNNCDGIIDNEPVDEIPQYLDQDGDGFGTSMSMTCSVAIGYATQSGDCDDENPNTYPNAPELCDGSDNDCDQLSDEQDAIDDVVWFVDSDGDGFGNASMTIVSCEQPDGYVLVAGDCQDDDVNIHPNAIEVCDSFDNNCDGFADDLDPQVDDLGRSSFYVDADGDGFGSGEEFRFCVHPFGYSVLDNDCDDTEQGISPIAEEICDGIDNDCDELVDDSDDNIDDVLLTNFYPDGDGDGFGAGDAFRSCFLPFGYSLTDIDCEDDNFDIHPEAIEICDGIDNDCDENIDDEDDFVDDSSKLTYYFDLDEDGYGDIQNPILSCLAPNGTTIDNTDCNDIVGEGELIFPQAFEICNGIDENCDGLVDANQAGMDIHCPASDCVEIWDAGSTESGVYFIEEGNDEGDTTIVYGYCEMTSQSLLCTENESERMGVTVDGSNITYLMNSILDIEEGICTIWSVREASVGTPFGYHALTSYSTCSALGFISNANVQYCHYGSAYSDCGFTQDLYYLYGTNCSGCTLNNGNFPSFVRMGTMSSASVISSMDGSISSSCTVLIDADGDGFLPLEQGGDDCNDSDVDININAIEVCDDIDNNCDGQIDEGFDKLWYLDADGDGFGVTETLVETCTPPEDHALQKDDCDDGENGFEINPLVIEICDGIDNNCDGMIDRDADDYGTMDSCPAIDCQDILDAKPQSVSGLYQIDVGSNEVFEVQCDMETDEGGWTIIDIQRHAGWKSHFASFSDLGSNYGGPSGYASTYSWNSWFQLDDAETEYRQSEDCSLVNTSASSQVYKMTGDHYGCHWYNGNCPMTGDNCNECTNNYGTYNSGSCWHLSSGPTSDYNISDGPSWTCSNHWWNNAPSIGTGGSYCVAYR